MNRLSDKKDFFKRYLGVLTFSVLVAIGFMAHAAVAASLQPHAIVAQVSTQPAAASPLDSTDPLAVVKMLYTGIKTGDWPEVAALAVILLVLLLRKFGDKVYGWSDAMSPRPSPVEVLHSALFFLLKTKPGGWLVNFLTTVSGGVFAAVLAGDKLDWSVLKPVLAVALTAAGLWEFAKDVYEWVQSKKAAGAPSQAQGPTLVPPPQP